MQTVNFNCSFCGKLMAVGINLLGRNVRCPHCKQILQAPATTGAPPTAPPPFAVQEPSFESPSAPIESPDSIFGEVLDEDVFGTRAPKVHMPNQPSAPPPPASRTMISNAPSVSAPPYSPPPPAPYVDARTEELPLPAELPPRVNPWGAAPPSAHRARNDLPPDDATELETHREELPQSSRVSRPAVRGGGGGIFVWMLLFYALVATGIAAYLFYDKTLKEEKQQADGGKKEHPFTAIPDLYGYYEKADRKKIQKFEGMPGANLEVPKELQVKLGESITIGQLEVTPLRVEYREIMRFRKPTGKTEYETKPIDRVYVLHLHLKNISDDVYFHPNDPALNRRYVPSQRDSIPPYSGIVIGKDFFLGGPLLWPDSDYTHQYIEGQENDGKLLGPKEERNTVVASDMAVLPIRTAVEAAGGTPIIWRVDLRRGLEKYKDAEGNEKEYSARSVIGVVLSPGEMR